MCKSVINGIPVRDLSDFCGRWENLQNNVDDAVFESANLPEDALETVKWLKKLAGKVCAYPPPTDHPAK